jgi:4-carboxymuconolactone decarboxylase
MEEVQMSSERGQEPEERSDGRRRRAQAQGRKTDKLGEVLAALHPNLLEWTDGFVFGSVWSGDALSFEERMLIAVALLTGLGATTQLKAYLHGAVQAGIDQERLREAVAMTTVYAGFPAALNGLQCLQEVLASEGGQTSAPA